MPASFTVCPPEAVLLGLLQILFGMVQFIVVCTALSLGLKAAAARKDHQPVAAHGITYKAMMVRSGCSTVKHVTCDWTAVRLVAPVRLLG